jgi:exodeoxyribonuclease VII large subunit
MELEQRSLRAIDGVLNSFKDRIAALRKALIHPGKKVQDAQLHLDHLTQQLQKNMAAIITHGLARLERAQIQMNHGNPKNRSQIYKVNIETMTYKLLNIIRNVCDIKKEQLKVSEALLTALNPVSILKRGYSITRTLPDNKIVLSAASIAPEQQLDIQLAHGHLEAVVEKSKKNKG